MYVLFQIFIVFSHAHIDYYVTLLLYVLAVLGLCAKSVHSSSLLSCGKTVLINCNNAGEFVRVLNAVYSKW